MLLVFTLYGVFPKPIQSMELGFTSNISVYGGFSKRKISSTFEPDSSDIVENYYFFEYEDTSQSFVLSGLFFYLQIFVRDHIKMELTATPLYEAQKDQANLTWSITNRNNSILWEADSSITWTRLADGTMRYELTEVGLSGEKLDRPRVYSEEIRMRIPVENISDTSNPYMGEIKMTVTTVS